MLNGQFVTALELEGREDGAQVMAVLLESIYSVLTSTLTTQRDR